MELIRVCFRHTFNDYFMGLPWIAGCDSDTNLYCEILVFG